MSAAGAGRDAVRDTVRTPAGDRLPMARCQQRLLLLWLALALVAFAVLIGQTLPAAGVYRAERGDVWNWFLPHVVPTLALMVGTVVNPATRAGAADTVDRFTYRLCVGLSLAFLAVLLGVLLAGAHACDATAPPCSPAAALRELAVVLTGVQTLVGLALGAFFVTRRAE